MDDEQGVVTDDTAHRLAVSLPWLASVRDAVQNAANKHRPPPDLQEVLAATTKELFTLKAYQAWLDEELKLLRARPDLIRRAEASAAAATRINQLVDELAELSGPVDPANPKLVAWQEAVAARTMAETGHWYDIRRLEHLQAWIAMREKQTGGDTDGIHFYKKDRPVVSGMFRFLETAFLDVERRREVNAGLPMLIDRLDPLDQHYAAAVTSIFGRWLVESSYRPVPKGVPKMQWANDFLQQLCVKAETKYQVVLIEAFKRGLVKNISDDRFCDTTLFELYGEFVSWHQKMREANPQLPEIDARDGLEKYNPLLFLTMTVAALHQADWEPVKAVRLLSCGPGDADTMTLFLGAIAGTWLGYEALSARRDIGSQLSAVEAHLQRHFSFSPDTAAEVCCQLALTRVGRIPKGFRVGAK